MNTGVSTGAYFSNILNDYPDGSASVTSDELKKLNNSYFSQSYSSTNNNWKSVAYMMDTSTSVWGKYANTTYADYAIGGPPIEMFMTSYGQKYNATSYQAKASSSTGYQIYCPRTTSWVDYFSNEEDYLNSSDSTYVIYSSTKAFYLWISSPANSSKLNVYTVSAKGRVDTFSCESGYVGGTAFRPLVCLSSDVKLVDAGNGTYNLSK